MAKATQGRARAFEIKRPQPDAAEIVEGLAEYNARRGRTDKTTEGNWPPTIAELIATDEESLTEHNEDFADWDF